MVLGDSQLPANPWLFSVALRGITETKTHAPTVGCFEVLEGSPGPVERDQVLQHPWPAFETEGQEAGELRELCRSTEEQAEPLEERLYLQVRLEAFVLGLARRDSRVSGCWTCFWVRAGEFLCRARWTGGRDAGETSAAFLEVSQGAEPLSSLFRGVPREQAMWSLNFE